MPAVLPGRAQGWDVREAFDFVRGKRAIANIARYGGWHPQWRALAAWAAAIKHT